MIAKSFSPFHRFSAFKRGFLREREKGEGEARGKVPKQGSFPGTPAPCYLFDDRRKIIKDLGNSLIDSFISFFRRGVGVDHLADRSTPD